VSDTTKIEWATATWNPWEGCTEVSPGCVNCYAAARNHRFGMDNWGKGKPRRRTSAANWKKPLAWNRTEELVKVSSEDFQSNNRPRIFPSLCDWLDDEVSIEWAADFLRLIHDTPSLDWLLLTKRPQNWRKRVNDAVSCSLLYHGESAWEFRKWLRDWYEHEIVPENIWLGASVEDRPRKERIQHLRETPAAVRFLSLEPLLEDLGELDLRGIHWVIVGGESGLGARPCNVEWIRNIVAQCKAAGVPCFVKQLGAKPCFDSGEGYLKAHPLTHPKGGDPSEWPADLNVREFPR